VVTKATARTGADVPLVGMARALADPTRLRIFLALRQAERCVSDLVASEGVPQPLVSHHLRALSRVGLVEARRADGFKLYAVSPDGIRAALALFAEVLDPDDIAPRARPGGNTACCQ
jgi:DNA-binding transcriptional ArsR family regulator